MNASQAPDQDPYILDAPRPDNPVILPQWINPGNTSPVSRYSDQAWSLTPLIDNPSTSSCTVHWTNCPAPFVRQLKPLTWVMINGQLRPTYLRAARGHRARGRVSAPEMYATCREWITLARWLSEREIISLADCTTQHWRDYVAKRIQDGLSRRRARRVCNQLTNLWAFDQLSAQPVGLIAPPWENEGVDDFLPAERGPGGVENTTEPLDPHVLGPLLVWAIRMVDDFADDILAAWAENRRLTERATTSSSSAGLAALEEFLRPALTGDAALPSTWHMGKQTLAGRYISGITGASIDQITKYSNAHGLSTLAGLRPGPCPLHVPVTGRINGAPWREHIDFTEAAELMRHLGTAAAIICLYLTGMRPQEVQGLRSGCCPDPSPDQESGRHLIRTHVGPDSSEKEEDELHLIHGRHFKNVTDDDGNHVSAGALRTVPWVAITPVVHAIRVLERIVPDGELLFSAAHHDFLRHRPLDGAMKNSTLTRRIEEFVAWANREAHRLNLDDQAIPADPHGAIALSRFRRTLAWHIARRPGGLVALAIQYGHMRTVLDTHTSSGYASRNQRGIHSILDVETALAAADTAARLRDQAAAGEKISGPAARRALTAAAHTPRFEGTIVPHTFARKAAAFLTRDGIVLYDNPEAFLICAFKHDNALCSPEPGATAPRQYACQTGCGNTVRTDTHARQLGQRADDLDQEAAHAPRPLANRLRATATRFRELADTHDVTARPAEELG